MEANGDELRRLRQERVLSLRELGDRANVTQDNVWKIERGITRRPHPKTIRKLAEALGVEPKALLRTDTEGV
jgi:transcriptional regulator with XRE-family HTH domain